MSLSRGLLFVTAVAACGDNLSAYDDPPTIDLAFPATPTRELDRITCGSSSFV